MIILKISLPIELYQVLQIIENAGFEAYVVGGFVRDSVLGLEVANIYDYDITTSAHPAETKQLFESNKIFDLGEKHGTIGVRRNKITYEITTFRVEEKYSDGRRPDEVTFVKDLKSDLSRRDFTINALAADKNGRIIDEFNGISDLRNRIIRTVGEPKKRFQEDSLRMFRAIRFAIRFEFQIESSTLLAIKENVDLLTQHSISGERIYAELSQILKNLKSAIYLLNETALSIYLFGTLIETKSIQVTHESDLITFPREIIESWSIIFYLGFANFSNDISHKIEMFFNRFPGIKNQNKYAILDICSIIRMTRNFPKQVSTNFIKLLAYQLEKSKKCNLSFIELLEHTINTLKALQYDLSIIRTSKIEELRKEYVEIQPVNGNLIKGYGFTGKQIGQIIEISNYLKIIHDKFDELTFLVDLKSSTHNYVSLNFDKFLPKEVEFEGLFQYVILPIIGTMYHFISSTNGNLNIESQNKSLIETIEERQMLGKFSKIVFNQQNKFSSSPNFHSFLF